MLLNHNAKLTVFQFGTTKVAVIDELYVDALSVREHALSSTYSISLTDYPGLHSLIKGVEGEQFSQDLSNLLHSENLLPLNCSVGRMDFSVVTVQPEKLRPRQQHPHIDPLPFFAVVHLSDINKSGTSFYENCVTGLQIVADDEQTALHLNFIKEYGAHKLPEGYNIAESALWKLIGHVEGKFNRLVFYPGNAYHGVEPGEVPQPFVLSQARITQRVWFRRT